MKALILALLLLALPVSVAAITCQDAGDVTLVGACTSGGATFDQFAVSTLGVVGAVGLADAPFTLGTTLGFHVATSPAVVDGLADILLSYHASGPTFTHVDLGNGGLNVWISEKVCGSPFLGAGCPTGLLAHFLVGPGDVLTVPLSLPASELYVVKDIMFSGPGAFISDFSNSHGLEPVPEPGTLLLLGTSLAGLGVWWKRRRDT